MIMGESFLGDENKILIRVQDDAYRELIWFLYHSSAIHYLFNIRYTWVFPDFVPILRKIKTFDHRVLQNAHDLIAAYYRFSFCPHQNPAGIPEDFDIRTYYLAAWKAYYLQETAILGTIEEFAEAIATAVAFQNTERGYASEDKLDELLKQRYHSLPLIHR
ncbi:MAG TPA: hypothetical protein PKJ34_12880 [Anaerolineaceae bacterium]|nr:hypothetical protein [Anaerolineaceae bacterium]